MITDEYILDVTIDITFLTPKIHWFTLLITKLFIGVKKELSLSFFSLITFSSGWQRQKRDMRASIAFAFYNNNNLFNYYYHSYYVLLQITPINLEDVGWYELCLASKLLINKLI